MYSKITAVFILFRLVLLCVIQKETKRNNSRLLFFDLFKSDKQCSKRLYRCLAKDIRQPILFPFTSLPRFFVVILLPAFMAKGQLKPFFGYSKSVPVGNWTIWRQLQLPVSLRITSAVCLYPVCICVCVWILYTLDPNRFRDP